MERTPAAAAPTPPRSRAQQALTARHNWVQLGKFCAVGASGYGVNLAVYTILLRWAGLHYLAAAACSFGVAVTNNYLLNRHWTFRGERGHFAYQGLRFLVVSAIALGANLICLRILVELGLGKIVAQAVAIVLVTPLNFIGNKLWSFRRR
jgi:dolichol-phosphate mannosyltransferase